jgi:hypothetical protein
MLAVAVRDADSYTDLSRVAAFEDGAACELEEKPRRFGQESFVSSAHVEPDPNLWTPSARREVASGGPEIDQKVSSRGLPGRDGPRGPKRPVRAGSKSLLISF